LIRAVLQAVAADRVSVDKAARFIELITTADVGTDAHQYPSRSNEAGAK